MRCDVSVTYDAPDEITVPIYDVEVTDLLTDRERSVLKLLAQGQSNRTIGKTLQLTEGTVKGYVSNILAKLKLEDRTQAALLAVKLGADQ